MCGYPFKVHTLKVEGDACLLRKALECVSEHARRNLVGLRNGAGSDVGLGVCVGQRGQGDHPKTNHRRKDELDRSVSVTNVVVRIFKYGVGAKRVFKCVHRVISVMNS